MPGRNRNEQPFAEAGVSEIVGAIMLISLVVLAVSIIAVVLFSQATPSEIPNVNFMIGSNYPPTTLYLYHNGGDNLRIGDFSVVLDGASQSYSLEGAGEYWTLGKRLNVDISTMASLPRQVTLVYNSTGGGAFALHSATVNLATGFGSISPDVIVTPTPEPTPAVEPVVREIFYRNYSRLRPTAAADLGQYFALDVISSGNSWIIASSRTSTATRVTYPLSTGNRVKITLRTTTQNFKVFGRDDMMWNMSATGVNVSIFYPGNTTWVPLFSNNNRNLYDAWINGCRDFGSTLTIQNTSSRIVHTTLIINNTRIIQGFDRNNIVVSRIHPVNPGLFTLDENTASNSVTFLGFADSTTANGVQCNSTACTGLLP